MISSLLAISKAGVEKLLVFGEENMLDVPLWKKITITLKYLPVFLLTSTFRTIGYATGCCVNKSSDSISNTISNYISAATLLLLFMVALSLIGFKLLCNLSTRCCGAGFLDDLSIAEIFEGALGEMFSITVWGSRGREGSRTIQLASFIFYFLIYNALILYRLFYFTSDDHNVSNPLVLHNVLLGSLCCGALSLPLFILQIFYMNRDNPIKKLIMNKNNHSTMVQCQLTDFRTLDSEI